jgi:hypothetical protein
MKYHMITGLAMLVSPLAFQSVEPKTRPDTPPSIKSIPTGKWRSEPPADCPFKPSASITGVDFNGRYTEFTSADTCYLVYKGVWYYGETMT